MANMPPQSAGSAFNDRPDLQDLLDEIRVYVASEAVLERGGPSLPRYGLLSLLSRDTPGYVYTHPAIAAVVDTAFTDGLHVFFYGPFLEALAQSERDHVGVLERVPLWLHEISHKLYSHHQRLRNIPHEVANWAKDASINPRIVFMLRELHQTPGPLFGKGWGMESEEQMARYSRMSEEQIARELMETQAAQPGAGTSHEHGAHTYGCADDTHTMTPKEFIDILERNPDIAYVKDLLDLPDSNDAKALRELEQRNTADLAGKIQYAKNLMKQYGDRYPGRHMDSYAVEILDDLADPKIQWKASIREMLSGHGMQMSYTTDMPGKLFYVDPSDMNLASEVYVGSHIPARPDSPVLVIIDTSGSVDMGMLRDFCSETIGIVSQDSGIGSVYAYCADTALRNEPMLIDARNVHAYLKRVEVSGRGGTDFVTPIRQAWAHPALKHVKQRFRALLYFTDLGAPAPQRSDLPADLPPMAYVTVPGCFDRHFADKVRSYARVIEIRPSTTVDLDTVGQPVRSSTPAAKRGLRP